LNNQILLTGATGFIGSHLLGELIVNDYEVVILVRKESNFWRINQIKNYSIFELENDLSNLDELFHKHRISAIVHLATEYGRNSDYSKVIKTNLLLSVRLVELAIINEVELFINTDTFSSKFPESIYLKNYISSKIFFKNYLSSIKNIKVANMQLEHVYGENDSEGKFFNYLLKKLMNGNEVIELTEGSQKRDFIYVKDVVSAYISVLKSKNDFQFMEFEVGTGNSIRVRDFVTELHKNFKSNSKLIFGAIPTRSDEIEDSRADISSLREIGWKSKYSLEQSFEIIQTFMINKRVG